MSGAADAQTVMGYGELLTITVDGNPVTFDFYDGNAGAYSGSNIGIDVQTTAPVDINTALAAIRRALRANGGPNAANADGGAFGRQFHHHHGQQHRRRRTTSTTAAVLGIPDRRRRPRRLTARGCSARVNQIAANDADRRSARSRSRAAPSPSMPATARRRTCRCAGQRSIRPPMAASEVWNLFYLTDSKRPARRRLAERRRATTPSAPNGSPNPPVEYTDLNGLTVNGVPIGDVRLQHGAAGLTQFADPNGTAQVTTLSQNGYAAGELRLGRGQRQWPRGGLLQQRPAGRDRPGGDGELQRRRTSSSAWTAASSQRPRSLASRCSMARRHRRAHRSKSSNTDISEEFTKLIVTQQAYAAGTRIVSTADQMLQEALNMVR